MSLSPDRLISAKISTSPDALARAVGDELVILDLASGSYFGLDATGARIWALLAEGRGVTEIRDVLVAEYEVARDQAEADLLELLEKLHAQGLVRIAE